MGGAYQEKLNRLRAAVLGANDGIVSVAATVVGVAGATTSTSAIGVAAAAAVVGGAISMALGEYVSVSSQVDSQEALIAKERAELRDLPEQELDELTEILEERGISPGTARKAAIEMIEKNALTTHLHFELGIDDEDIPSPWSAVPWPSPSAWAPCWGQAAWSKPSDVPLRGGRHQAGLREQTRLCASRGWVKVRLPSRGAG